MKIVHRQWHALFLKQREVSIFVVLFVSFLSLGCESKVLETREGIPRKIIVSSEDGTTLYADEDFQEGVEEADQWDPLFILAIQDDSKEKDGYFKVSKKVDDYNESFYVRKEDAFEWNSDFSLAFRNSPHLADRPIVKIYETLEGLKSGDGNVVMQEKEEHSGEFRSTSTQPVLKDLSNEENAYRIAALYDICDKQGICRFEGDYDFGFVEFDREAYRLYRYVSEQQLRDNANAILAARAETTDETPNPEGIRKTFNYIGSVIDENLNIKEGVKDISRVFKDGDEIPEIIREGVLGEDIADNPSDFRRINRELIPIYEEMTGFLENDSNWEDSEYVYVPVEWMRQ